MSFNIAVAGKGGSGKTSITSLVIRYLLKNGLGPILAVDADSNANLGESLGLEVEQTIGLILADFQGDKIKIPSGMTKQNYLDYKLNGVVSEGEDLDLITMGRGDGPECYCYPNVVLRSFVDSLSNNYKYVVMDNEAGLEHLSRRTTRNIDELLIISNHSVKGIRTVANVIQIVSELELMVKKQSVVINYAPPVLNPLISKELDRLGIEPAAIVPQDEEIYKYDLELKPLLHLPDTSVAVGAVNNLMDKILKKDKILT